MAKGSGKKRVPFTLEDPEGSYSGEMVVTEEDFQKIRNRSPAAKRILSDRISKAVNKHERAAKKAVHDLVDANVDRIAKTTEELFNAKVAAEVRVFLTRKTQHLRGRALFAEEQPNKVPKTKKLRHK